jgi:alkaline phosphatase
MKLAILLFTVSVFISINGHIEEEMEDFVMHPTFEKEQPLKPDAITPEERTKQYWIDNAMSFVERQLNLSPNKKKAKNIIFFLGDGMSHTTVGKTNKILYLESKFNFSYK